MSYLVRAEGRRPGDRIGVRTRAAGAGRDPRRRADRGGRHPERPHAARRPGSPGRLDGRCLELLEVRGEIYFPVAGFGELNASLVESEGRDAVRQPAQRGGGFVAAEGPTGHRDTAAAPGGARPRRLARASRVESASRTRTSSSRPGPGACRSAPTAGRSHRTCPAVSGFIDHYGEHRHSVEHEIDGVVVKVDEGLGTCSASSAPPAGHRGGRSRSSTRHRRSTPSCSRSRSTSDVPAA